MTAKEIYKNMCLFRKSEQNSGISPNMMKERGIKTEDMPINKEDDEISRTKYYGNDGGYVVESYSSYDHSRTFELRPDSNHFKITLYDKNGNQLETENFVYWDEQ